MCNEAACITDRVLPSVPVRPWVLSIPFDLRAIAATKPDVRTAIGRTFAQEISRATKRLANMEGTETGVVSFHQSFGGSLNAHAHWHDVAVDGVFEKVGDCLAEQVSRCHFRRCVGYDEPAAGFGDELALMIGQRQGIRVSATREKSTRKARMRGI